MSKFLATIIVANIWFAGAIVSHNIWMSIIGFVWLVFGTLLLFSGE
jgi:hypothetical protein